jgi:ATP-dependent DNA ligase
MSNGYTFENFNHTNLLRPKNYNGQDVAYYQEKKDGIRITIFKSDSGIRAITRNGITDYASELLAIPRLKKEIENLPDKTILDCEAYVPGVQAANIVTHLLQSSRDLRLGVFAAPFYDGFCYINADIRDMDNFFSDTLSENRSNNCLVSPLHWVEVYSLSAEFAGNTPQICAELLLERAKRNKIEGYVLKNGHYHQWYKLKPTKTVDCFVVGYNKSTSGTFLGGLKSLQVAVHDDENYNGSQDGIYFRNIGLVPSGFDADYRMEVDLDSLIGKVCEVEFDSWTDYRKLKFPRFLRWREDKTREECTLVE